MNKRTAGLLRRWACACATMLLACALCVPAARADEQPLPVLPEGTEDAQTASVESEGTASSAQAEPEVPEPVDDAEPTGEALVAQAGQGRLSVVYEGHVQDVGWVSEVADGASCGTTGLSRRVEALRIRLMDENGQTVPGISYRAHVQNVGWQDWASDGEMAGTSHRSLRVEALQIKLSDELARRYDVYYRLHVQDKGWLDWACNGQRAGSRGLALRAESIAIRLIDKEAGEEPPANVAHPFADGAGVAITAHVQNLGWQPAQVGKAGTTGRGYRIEALQASLRSVDFGGGISYRTHVQNVGWQDGVRDGQLAGTTGRSLRIEAASFELYGEVSEQYDLWYRAHVQNKGWLGWAKNGAYAGTQGLALRVEAFEVRLVAKGAEGPSDAGSRYAQAFIGTPGVSVATQSSGQDWAGPVTAGVTAGTTGKSVAIEQLSVELTGEVSAGSGVAYEVRPASGEWLSASDGAAAGEEGTPIEAVRLTLTGELADAADVYYRAHISNYGWLAWTSDGASAGSAGIGSYVEALQVRVVMHGGPVPDATGAVLAGSFIDKAYETSEGQLLSSASARQRCVALAAQTTPPTPTGYCAEWVSNVFRAAGEGDYYGNANDLYRLYCMSYRRQDLKVGMIVAVSRHPHTYLGSLYGHVCIYVGNGMVRDSVSGQVRYRTLDQWVQEYGGLVPVRWGWIGNVALG